MVKSVSSSSYQGLRDWLVQRVTAVIMVLYSVLLTYYLIAHPGMDFVTWHALFIPTWMKVATMLFFVSIFLHAWVGIWTILTDYIKPVLLSFVLHTLVLLSLWACFFWVLLIVVHIK